MSHGLSGLEKNGLCMKGVGEKRWKGGKKMDRAVVVVEDWSVERLDLKAKMTDFVAKMTGSEK